MKIYLFIPVWFFGLITGAFAQNTDEIISFLLEQEQLVAKQTVKVERIKAYITPENRRWTITFREQDIIHIVDIDQNKQFKFKKNF